MNTANELRNNADSIEANAPAEETNAEIYKGYLYDVFARNYTDNQARGIERADAVFEVIDTIAGTFAKENGLTKDQFYGNFVLSKEGDVPDQALFRDAGKFAGGATYWLDNGKAVIHAFKRADVPDMLHEYIHAITPMLNDADKSTVANWYNKEYGRALS